MPNTTTSPYMNLPVPVVSTDPGPDWANDINACMSAIDSHDHTTGKGVPLTPDALNINADLPMNGYNLTAAGAVTFQAKISALTSLLRSLQVVSADLYFIDGAGNSVRITQGGSVTGSSGTITGLPSGTASASYAGGTFTFDSATNTPANMAVGPLIIGSNTASPKTVTLGPSSSQPANYNLTFPLAAPSANQLPISDGSGNLSWSWGLLPIGSVVATFPNLSGAYTTSATTSADTYGFVKCVGQTISDAASPMNGAVVPNINNDVFLKGSTTAGTAGGAATTSGVGAHTHTFTSSTSVANSSHTHIFFHTHEWGYSDAVDGNLRSRTSSDVSSTSIGSGQPIVLATTGHVSGALGTLTANLAGLPIYTTGVLDAPGATTGVNAATSGPTGATTVAGTTDSTGTSFSIIPTFISTVYLMRIK